jgi:hypothetical protein
MTDTIFIQIASYRDPELNKTLEDCISNAKWPENLRFTICWQHSSEDDWDNLDKWKEDSRFNILDFNYVDAKGACWARNQIQQQYNNEKYTLHLDSHHRFIKNWDEELINMHSELISEGYKKPLITSYLPSYFPDKEPNNRVQECWQLDFGRFTPEGYIWTQPSTIPAHHEKPIPSRLFSAHFVFTNGEFAKDVQHDPEMYFHGEEPSLAARAFTHGYDLFHPHKIIAWHEYDRNGKKKQWDDDREWSKKDRASHLRYRRLHSMDGLVFDPNEFGKYGFGTSRTLREYEIYAGFDFKSRRITSDVMNRIPPKLENTSELDWKNNLVDFFKHCIDIHIDHFKHDDYSFWVISFEEEDGKVIRRLDADSSEVNRLLNACKNGPDDFVRIWREYNGPIPYKFVIWPHSNEHGYVERYEKRI